MIHRDPKVTHAFEQMTGAMAELAKATAFYYRALIAEGVPPEHAVQVTIAWQARFLRLHGDDPSRHTEEER